MRKYSDIISIGSFLILFSFFILKCQLFDHTAKSQLAHIKSMETARALSSINCSANQNGAVVVMYHRFDGKYSSTSVTKELLQKHLSFFRLNGFNIVSLEKVVRAVQTGESLPPKTLAITVDDAYRSTYEIAHPLFLRYQAPYTVFVNTKAVDQNIPDYMSWNQLRSLAQSDLTDLSAHSHAHAYMIRELNSAQREEDIKTSVIRIYQETGHLPVYFAYPYGETNKRFINEVQSYRWNIGGRQFRFLAAFTTQSGPVGCSSSLFALPRFALNMNYGKLNDLFRSKMMSRHFPIQSFSPTDLAFCSSEKIQQFSLSSSHLALNGLNCFSSNGEVFLEQKSSKQVDIILKQPFIKGLRQRINCTMPAGKRQFFWFGKEFSILNC